MKHRTIYSVSILKVKNIFIIILQLNVSVLSSPRSSVSL